MQNKLAQWLLVIVLVSGAFVGGVYWRESMEATPTSEPCNADALSFQLLDSLLRRFDDSVSLAVNVTRDQVVNQVEEMQLIRRQVEELPVPGCLSPVKTRMVDYMNQVVDLLVAFVGGVSPDLVFQGLAQSNGLRDVMQAVMADLTGVTVTPYPTAFQFSALLPALRLRSRLPEPVKHQRFKPFFMRS